MVDIHTHILPNIDDGSKSVEESLRLLSLLKKQGISDVVATPHFYPHLDSLEEFSEKRSNAFKNLLFEVRGKDLPNIYLGCEILYFRGISRVEDLEKLCLNNTRFMLIELTDDCIDAELFSELLTLKNEINIIPIIAHTERYFKAKNYKKFLKFLKNEKIIVQINADSLLKSFFASAVKKLIKSDLRIVIASDTHSLEQRPPYITKALNIITEKYGKTTADRILRNNSILFKNIIGGE